MGMSGNFLSYIKGLNDPFEAQDGRWDFSRDAAADKALRGDNPGFSRVVATNFGFLSSSDGDLRDPLVWPRKVQSPCELRGASRDSSPVSATS